MSPRTADGQWYSDHIDTDYLPRRYETRLRITSTVLNTSMQLLREVGPRAFTVKEVARRARIGRTTIYKYFGLKAELLAACRAHAARKLRNLQFSARAARIRADRRSGLPRTLELVRQAVLALLRFMREDADLFLLAAAEGVRAKRRPKERAPLYGRDPREEFPLPMRLMQTVTALLQEAAHKGEVRPGVDARSAALWLGALWWQGLSARGPSADGWQDLTGAQVEQLLRSLAAG